MSISKINEALASPILKSIYIHFHPIRKHGTLKAGLSAAYKMSSKRLVFLSLEIITQGVQFFYGRRFEIEYSPPSINYPSQ